MEAGCYFLNQRFIFCTLLLGICLAVFGCGAITHSANGLEISLRLPEEESPDRFWIGVKSRSLRVDSPGEDPRVIPWNVGQEAELDLKKGDKVEFLGQDAEARVLVYGESSVGEEKKITILLSRVL
jgi:hypothetical protein